MFFLENKKNTVLDTGLKKKKTTHTKKSPSVKRKFGIDIIHIHIFCFCFNLVYCFCPS